MLVHVVFWLSMLIAGCAWAGGVERTDSRVDRSLLAVEYTKDGAARRQLTSELVEYCASHTGDRPLALSELQIARLVRLLRDSEPWVRANAAACLGFDGPSAASALPALREAERTTPLVEYPGFPGLQQATQPRDLISTAIRRVEGAIPVHNAGSAPSLGG
jgi:hypothetical protein